MKKDFPAELTRLFSYCMKFYLSLLISQYYHCCYILLLRVLHKSKTKQILNAVNNLHTSSHFQFVAIYVTCDTPRIFLT